MAIFNGTPGDDVLTGGPDDDTLNGFNGNDTLNGGAGVDTLIGGPGDDTYYVDNTADVVTENPGEGTDTVFSSVSYTLPANVENLTLTGSTVANGVGNTLNNVIVGNASTNILIGDAGDDTLVGGNGDLLLGGAGADTLDGTGGNVTAVYLTSPGAVTVDLSHQTASGGDATGDTLLSIENVIGSNFSDFITGSNVSNNLQGDTGDDTLDGGDGDDSLSGGDGVDTLIGGLGNDAMNGGAGADIMTGGLGDDLYGVDNSGDQIVENVGEGNDTVAVFTGTGLTAYTLGASASIELLAANDATLTVGLDLTGNDFAQTILGNAGANRLSGLGGADTLNGLGGNDILTGGAGIDTLTGGAGADLFRDTIAGLNGDTITDLSYGDTLQITDAVANGFTFALNGSTLTFSGGGSLTLSNLPTGTHLVAAAAAQGVALHLVSNPIPNNGLSGDFNGDGKDDLLWRSDAGQMSNWLGKANGGFQGNDGNAFVNVPTSWHVVAAGDFNGDGRDDIVWRSDSGQMSDWLGTASGGWAGNDANALTVVDTSWKIIGAGDFNGDGRDDILWRSNAGQLSNWLGQANGGFVGNDANAFASVSTNWHIVGVGDFNGDNRDDILWRSDAGQLSNWLGTASGGWAGNDANAFVNVPTDWHIVGVGDFNGDGRSDILWRSDSGLMSNWLGTASGGWAGNDANAMASIPTDWVIAGVGDYNGDGRDDIVWRHTSGAMSDWLGQANGGFAGNDANAYQIVDPSWHIQVHDLFAI